MMKLEYEPPKGSAAYGEWAVAKDPATGLTKREQYQKEYAESQRNEALSEYKSGQTLDEDGNPLPGFHKKINYNDARVMRRIAEIPPLTIRDTITEPPKNESSMLAGLNGYKDLAQFEIDSLKAKQAAMDTAKQNQSMVQQSIWSVLGETDRNQKAQEIGGEIGFDAETYFSKRIKDRAELETLNTEYNNLLTAKSESLAAVSENRNASQRFIDRETAQQEKRWNIRLNQAAATIYSKLAVMAAEKEDFESAKGYITEAVNNFVADQQDRIKMFENFEADNAETLAALGKETEAIFKEAKEKAQSELDDKKETAEEVGKLRIKYADGSWPSNWLELSLPEAIEIASNSPSNLRGLQPKSETIQPTAAMRNAELESGEIGSIAARLEATKGNDGYTSPAEYQRLRRYATTMSTAEFDKRFADMLSPQERKNLGIDKASAKNESNNFDYGVFNLQAPAE